MKPGATIIPPASKMSVPGGAPTFPGGPTSAMRSPSRNTSLTASVLLAGSRTRPFLTSSMRGFLGLRLCRRVRDIIGSAANEQIQDCHAHGHAVRHLFKHAGLRPVGYLGRYLDAAIHRPGMQHDGIRLRAPQPRGI